MNHPAGHAEEPGNVPASLGPFHDRTDGWSFVVTTVLVFAVYLWTLAPNVTLGFSGMYATGAMYAGVPNPPGYPLWTILGWGFVKLLPFSNVAWRLAVFSALAGALTCGLIALMVSRGGAWLPTGTAAILRPDEQRALRVVCGAVAGMGFGFSDKFWGRAVIVDVWPLSMLLLALLVYLLMRWLHAPQHRRWLYAAGLIYGLAITNSQTLLVLAPALPLVVVLVDRKLGRDFFLAECAIMLTLWGTRYYLQTSGLILELIRSDSYGYEWLTVYLVVATGILIIVTRRVLTEYKTVLICGALFALGFSLYFYIAIASMTNPPVNWGYPRTEEGFFHVLSRGQYERIIPTGNSREYIRQLGWYVEISGKAWGWAYLVALLPAVFFGLRNQKVRRWLLSLGVLFIALGPGMIFILNPPADRSAHLMIASHYSASYLVLAIVAGYGLILSGSWWVGLMSAKPKPDHEPNLIS